MTASSSDMIIKLIEMYEVQQSVTVERFFTRKNASKYIVVRYDLDSPALCEKVRRVIGPVCAVYQSWGDYGWDKRKVIRLEHRIHALRRKLSNTDLVTLALIGY